MRSQEDIERELMQLRDSYRLLNEKVDILNCQIKAKNDYINHLETIQYALVETIKLSRENKK